MTPRFWGGYFLWKIIIYNRVKKRNFPVKTGYFSCKPGVFLHQNRGIYRPNRGIFVSKGGIFCEKSTHFTCFYCVFNTHFTACGCTTVFCKKRDKTVRSRGGKSAGEWHKHLCCGRCGRGGIGAIFEQKFRYISASRAPIPPNPHKPHTYAISATFPIIFHPFSHPLRQPPQTAYLCAFPPFSHYFPPQLFSPPQPAYLCAF